MASIDDSGLLQYHIFQWVLNSLSNKQHNRHLQLVVVDDLRSAFILITELQKTVTELQLQGIQTATSLRVSNLIKFTLSLAPHAPVLLCMPVDADMPSPDLVSVSSHSHLLLVMPTDCNVSSSVVAMHKQPTQGGLPNVVGSLSQGPQLGQLQALTSEVMCQTPRHWPQQPLVPICSHDVPMPPAQQRADLHEVSAPLLPAYLAPVPASASVAVCDHVLRMPSSVRLTASCCDEVPWSCLRGCRFERSSYAAVKKHERRCQVSVHPTEQALLAGPQAEQGSSGCSTVPELTGSSAAVSWQSCNLKTRKVTSGRTSTFFVLKTL